VRQGAPGASSCSSAFRNAPRTFPRHQARETGLPLHYQYRDCAALPNRPPGLVPAPARGPDHHNLIPGATPPRRGLAEPTGPAQVSRTYLYMVSPGRGVFPRPFGASPYSNNDRCTGVTLRKAPFESLGPSAATPALRQETVKSRPICSANTPSPFSLTQNLES
jgi:hypothetical protein